PAPNISQRSVENTVTVKAGSPGLWFFHVVVKDKAGNLSQATHFPVRVAGSEPPPPMISSPTHPREDEPFIQHDPLFTWEDRFEGSVKITGYVYKLSAKPEEKLEGRDSFTTEKTIQLKDVEEGTWYFHVASVGKNGK